MGKYISKILSKHYNQKLIALAKISATVTIKTASKEYFKKTAAEIHYKVIKKQLKVKQNIEKYQKNIHLMMIVGSSPTTSSSLLQK